MDRTFRLPWILIFHGFEVSRAHDGVAQTPLLSTWRSLVHGSFRVAFQRARPTCERNLRGCDLRSRDLYRLSNYRTAPSLCPINMAAGTCASVTCFVIIVSITLADGKLSLWFRFNHLFRCCVLQLRVFARSCAFPDVSHLR